MGRQPSKEEEEVAERLMGEFSPLERANIAWAFATAAQLDATLFSVLAGAAEQRVGELQREVHEAPG